MMKVITLVTQKGGSGKSTLCVSLAVAAHEAGHSVCILEMDRQATVTQWAKQRHGMDPEVAQISADKLDGALKKLRTVDCEYVFLDTPGIDSPGTNLAIAASDLCLVPCRPTPADLKGVGPTLGAIFRLEKDFAFVLNQTPPKGIRIKETAEGLSSLGVLADVNIVMRNDHQDAMGKGEGVTEFNPTGPAADEIRKLWAWIDNRTKAIPHVKAA